MDWSVVDLDFWLASWYPATYVRGDTRQKMVNPSINQFNEYSTFVPWHKLLWW